MNSNKTEKVSIFSQVLLWFGAAVSIAEIITGALIAPLGLSRGILAIIVGHIIGAIILYMAGYIGASSNLSSAWTARISFGKFGSYGFSILNLLQLLGWTAIMIINGAVAMNGVSNHLWGFGNQSLWAIAIGALIIIWVLLGSKNLAKVNVVVMLLLLAFSIVLGVVVFGNEIGEVSTGLADSLSFGMAVELNVAMCLSWLPLISDYTRKLNKPAFGTLGSVLGYFVGSMLMFIIGLGAAIYVGTSDISEILLSAGLGIVALIIVVFSTVTTTFLDVYSAGVSIANLNKKIPEKISAIVVCVIGTVMAIFLSMSQYENFLYLIGSAFAPIFAILFTDYYILKKRSVNPSNLLDVKNVILWIIGFICYRLLMPYATFIGITVPVIVGVAIICVLVNKIWSKPLNILGKADEDEHHEKENQL